MFKDNKGESLFKRETIPFDNIQNYLRDFTQNGDYFIPVCGDIDSTVENGSDIHEDSYIPDQYIRQYDERLVRVYRHQGSDIVLKNVKMLNGSDPSKMGLKGKAIEYSYDIDKEVNCLPSVKISHIISILQKGYDKMFADKSTGFVPKLNIWIPIWGINNTSAAVFTIFGRIKIILT